MVKLVEPTRVCTNLECPNAGQRQPWSNFYSRTYWPDGSVRTVKSECKVCDKARARRWQQGNPDKVAVLNRRAYDRLKADPELWATHIARIAEWQGRSVVAEHRRVTETIDSAPFVAWLREIMERDGTSQRETAARLGMGEKTLREVLDGRNVELGTVERALFADDTTTLRELYPSLYAEAAA